MNGTIEVGAGTGNLTAQDGSYAEVCGFVGLAEAERSLGWVIYPNPVAYELTIGLLSGAIDDQYEVTIVDALGKIVTTDIIESTQKTISVSDLPSGVYTVRLSGNSTTETKRFIKN